MKKILFFLIFTCISSQTLSEVGDIYYCEMTQAIELKEEKLIKYIPQKFKFTILGDNSIKFGEDANYFRGLELEVIAFSNDGEQFYGDSFEYSYGSFYFADVIRWTSTSIDKLTATAVSAKCSLLEDYTV